MLLNTTSNLVYVRRKAGGYEGAIFFLIYPKIKRYIMDVEFKLEKIMSW